ncbi:MAG: hypothetical protein PHE50_09665, partial [Dehalococcoidales bacterium]|nr:hypothetical protein [Dehalococcoidales bacterium]
AYSFFTHENRVMVRDLEKLLKDKLQQQTEEGFGPTSRPVVPAAPAAPAKGERKGFFRKPRFMRRSPAPSRK